MYMSHGRLRWNPNQCSGFMFILNLLNEKKEGKLGTAGSLCYNVGPT